MRWPFRSAVLDGEVCAGNGMDGIASVFEARGRPDGDTALCLFDVLRVDGHSVMAEPWAHRRKRLADLLDGAGLPRVTLVAVSDDARALWDTRTALGGEGIVSKDRHAPHRPGVRSPAWLKLKQRLTLGVRIEDGPSDLILWGDWGWAVRVTLTYQHRRTGAVVTIDEIVRVPRPDGFTIEKGAIAEVLCWGVMPSGRLRHPVFRR